MELSKAIASIAVVLGVILAAGHAFGDGAEGSTALKPAVQEREAQRRAAIEEQQKRKEAYERACNRTLKTEAEFNQCRAAYRRLQVDKL